MVRLRAWLWQGLPRSFYKILVRTARAATLPGMTVTVICNNQDCSQQGLPRIVGRQHLGQSVYIGGELLCYCGFAMTEAPEETR